ncbi:hypothetical protein PT276_06885 [Orbaceae bacterium ESL0721]|nr:hypothetical protein [Orbaceae bacterium ESL0721]
MILPIITGQLALDIVNAKAAWPFSDYKSYIVGLGDDRTPKTPQWAEKIT